MNTVNEIKPYSMKELSEIYNIGIKSMRNWLKPFKEEIGQRRGRYYNVAQIEIIFKRLGLPHPATS